MRVAPGKVFYDKVLLLDVILYLEDFFTGAKSSVKKGCIFTKYVMKHNLHLFCYFFAFWGDFV